MQTEQGGLYRPAPFLCFICAQRLFASVLFYFSLFSKSTMRQFEYLLRHSSNPQLRKSESWQSEERMNSPPRSVMYSAMSKAGEGVSRLFLAIAPIKMPDERRIYFLSELRDIFIICLRKAYKRAAEIFVDIVDLVLRRRLVNGDINISRLHIVNRTDCVVEFRQISFICVKIRLETDVYPDLVCIFFAQGFELIYISARLVCRHAV